MDSIKQRIAIAKACGWWVTWDDEYGPLRGRKDETANVHLVPDYLNDLNAMHEAFNQRIKPHAGLTSKFGEVLQDVQRWYCVGVVPDYRSDLISLSLLSNASAAQRAEAFLKTLSLWVENADVVAPPPLVSEGGEVEELKGGCPPTSCSESSLGSSSTSEECSILADNSESTRLQLPPAWPPAQLPEHEHEWPQPVSTHPIVHVTQDEIENCPLCQCIKAPISLADSSQ